MPRRSSALYCLILLGTLAAALAAPAAAAADTLRGRVVDPQRRPVADAEVIVRRGTTVVRTARTDAEGRFGPLTLPPGAYDVLAGAPGLRAPARAVQIAAGRPADVTIALTVAAIGEAIVVSAAQVDTPLSQVADAVTVIDRSTTTRLQMTTAADALQLVPGFHVVRSGGPGGLVSIFPRGGESDYTLVVVDGVAQNTFGGGFDGAHLTTADVDRIEVVRGPQSALHGGGAIGGIVHAVSDVGGPLRAHAAIEAGSHGTTSAAGRATGSRGSWGWRGAFDWLGTDGDTRQLPALGTRVSNADYERFTGAGSLAWGNAASRVRVDVRGGQNELGNPGPFGADPMGFFGGLDLVARGRNRFVTVGAAADIRQTPALTHRAHMSWATFNGHFLSSSGGSDDDTRRVTGRYQLDLNARVPASAGVELQHERADNTFVTDEDSREIPVNRTLAGFFVEVRPVIGRSVFVNLGARAERIARQSLAGDAFGSRPAFAEDDIVWSANPKLAVAWMARGFESATASVLGWTKIRLGAGTGIKPPTTFEIAFTDNPSLKPERSRSVDVGIEQAFGAGTLVGDATWFRNTYDDLIVSVPTALRDRGISRHRSDNIANARAAGLELGATWRPASPFAVRGAWTWLDTEVLGIDQAPDDAPVPYVVGDPLIRRPRHQGSLAITWTTPRAGVFLRVYGRGTVLDLEPNFGAGACFGMPASCRAVFDAPGYASTDAGGSFRLTETLELYGRVSNLFDRSYEEVLGFPALGRAGIIGLRVTGSR